MDIFIDNVRTDEALDERMTTAVALALTVRIREAYGTVEEDEIAALDGESG